MALTPGAKLGHYEILAPLGAGGMGEVYRARDGRLGRDVAIKSLPAEFARDPERLARFEREARLLASLSHPNIAGILGLEEVDGARYLVMEVAEGEDLSTRIGRGPLPVDEAITVALQVARALESAHERGIIHRDLKPANIKLAPDGTIKVLDFGLARAFEGDISGSDPRLSQSPTITHAMTMAGTILGTAAYMSPEQARGRSVDRRADIWAFGAVFYEMLTGRRLFDGETISETIASVIKDAPRFEALPADLPAGVRRLIERCLVRDPTERLRDIGEARIILANPEGAFGSGPAEAGSPTIRRGVPVWLTAAAVILVAVLSAALGQLGRRPAAPTPTSKFDMPASGIDAGWTSSPVLSPDGRRFAYLSKNRLWVRDLGQLTPRAVADLAGSTPAAWSPDSRWLAYCDREKIWKVQVDGGSPISLCEVSGSGTILGAAWSLSGRIAFAGWRGAIHVVSETGGAAPVYVPLDSTRVVDYHFPTWLPNGDLLFATHWKAGEPGVPADEWLTVFDGKRMTPVHGVPERQIAWPAVDPAGTMLFVRDDPNRGIWGAAWDEGKRQLIGEMFPVEPGAGSLSLSATGALLYLFEPTGTDVSELHWTDRTGKPGEAIGPTRARIRSPRFSPDGARIAFATGADVWVHDLKRDTGTRLTFGGQNADPRWFPSGARLLYAARKEMSIHPMALNADGSGDARPLAPTSLAGAEAMRTSMSPDGRFVVTIIDRGGRGGLRIARIQPDGTIGSFEPFLKDSPEPDINEAEISPDGRLLAYVVNNVERPELFVTRFPDAVGRWQVSTDGGRQARWVRDTGELFFLAGGGPDAREMSVATVRPDMDPPVGATTRLFKFSERDFGAEGWGFDVTPDGKRLVMVRRSGADDAVSRLVLVQNYRAQFPGAAKGRS